MSSKMILPHDPVPGSVDQTLGVREIWPLGINAQREGKQVRVASVCAALSCGLETLQYPVSPSTNRMNFRLNRVSPVCRSSRGNTGASIQRARSVKTGPVCA